MDNGEHVARDKLVEHVLSRRDELKRRGQPLGRLVLVRTGTTSGAQNRGVERKDAFQTQHLLDAVLGVEVHDVCAADMTVRVGFDHVVGHNAGVFDRGIIGLTHDAHDLVRVLVEIIRCLTTAGNELDFLGTMAVEVVDALLGCTLHLHVEATGQSTVGADRDHQGALVGLGFLQERVARIGARVLGDREHDIGDGGGVGLGARLALKRASDLGRRHHLHGARDLLGRGDRVDTLLYFAEVSHRA